MAMSKITAIVLSGGSGTRMHADRAKQYIEVNGRPILCYALSAFETHEKVDEIILVTRKEDISYCAREIVEKYGITKVTKIVAGGDSRAESVLNGMRAITNTDYVLIHDGARPLVDRRTIDCCIEGAISYHACAAAMPVKDTIKEANDLRIAVNTPDRSRLYQMQTPQGFVYSSLLRAYEKMETIGFAGVTDDAMVMETAGDEQVFLSEGSYRNIKITTEEDLLIMKAFMKEV